MFDAQEEALSSRPFVIAAVLAALLWFLAGHFLADTLIDWQEKRFVAEAETKTRQAINELRTGMETTVGILHAIPHIVSHMGDVRHALFMARQQQDDTFSSDSERRAAWENDPYFSYTNQLLARSVADIRPIDTLWVMTPEGKTILSSNAGREDSFVGSDFSKRQYFQMALEGHEGQQFAVGWRSRIAGLYFASAVLEGGKVTGVVAGKVNISELRAIVTQSSAFLVDTNGIIIQSGDPRLEMMAMPDSTVTSLSENARMARYRQKDFPVLAIEPWEDSADSALVRFNKSEVPYYVLSVPVLDENLRLFIATEIAFPGSRPEGRHLVFGVILAGGLLVIFFTILIVYQVRQARFARQSRDRQSMLEHLAAHDQLTGVYRRGMTDTLIASSIAEASASDGHFAVMFVDLDFFKDINDTHGHAAGDEVLKETANRLRGSVRKSDCVIRYGGDEFVIVLGNISSAAIAGNIASHILQTVRQPIPVNDMEMRLSASIGIAIYPDDGKTVEALLLAADTALYHVKENGRASYTFYDKTQTLEKMTQPLEN